MFVCADCGELFEEPTKYQEHLGPSGESRMSYEFYGCPKCAGAFLETRECSICREPISGEYIKTQNGDFICENCYDEYDVMEDGI